MSPQATQTSHAATGFPRVSGDEPTEMHIISDKIRFSPRERG